MVELIDAATKYKDKGSEYFKVIFSDLLLF